MTTPQPSVLTINVFKAYLNPLLTKHEGGKVIVYEDLLASWEAVQAVLSKNESTPDASQVKDKIQTLHDEQVLEYKKAGKRALIEYSRNCFLPVGDSSDPNHTLKCIRYALNGAPDWKLPRSTVLAILQKVIQVRLNSASSKSPTPTSPSKPPAQGSQTTTSISQLPASTSQTPAPTKISPKLLSKENEPVSTLEEGEEEETPAEGEETAPSSGNEGEIEEGEEAEDEEEGEEPEEQTADGESTEKTDTKGTNNKTKGLLAKKKALGKTAAPKKKTTTIKGGRTARGRVARRGGRGGGKA